MPDSFHARYLILITALLCASDASATPLSDDRDVLSSVTQFDRELKSNNVPPNAAKDETTQRKTRDELTLSSHTDFWIYDSWVTLSDDFDADGFYTRIEITFDADTIYSAADGYAIIYLGRNGIYESIHTTSLFTLNSDSSHDALTINSELLSGFPSADYDVLIELYDAASNELVASADDYSDADLAYLSLESRNFDTAGVDRTVVVREHGGSLYWLNLFILAGLALWRQAVTK